MIFDLDGVVTDTASVHATAWKAMFDSYLKECAAREGVAFEPFDEDADYRRYVDGKPRYDGVRDFLAAHGLTLPFGDPKDSKGSSLAEPRTTKLWRKYHLSYDQTRYVTEQVRHELKLSRPKQRRRTIARLDKYEVERLIEAAYRRGSRYGLMVKMLFYIDARVGEFVNIKVNDLHLELEPPQVYLAVAKGQSDGFVPILPVLAQELRTHLTGRTTTYLFESNRRAPTPRARFSCVGSKDAGCHALLVHVQPTAAPMDHLQRAL